MLPTLYKLTEDYQAVWNMVLDDDANLDMLQATLEAIEGAIEVKAQNTAAVIKQLDANSKIIAEEIKRLQLRKKALDNRAERIKAYLQYQLEAIGTENIKTPAFSISLQDNPPALLITDPGLIPAEYTIVKYEQDNAAIKDALKAGKEVPGATLTVGKSLRIR